MGVGSICHKEHVLNEICYEANVADLIRAGHLCQLRTIKGEADIDLEGVKKSGGDYNLKDLALRVDNQEVVCQAVRHLVKAVRENTRKSIIVFCIDVEHCQHVAQELRKYGIDAPTLTGKTPQAERERLTKDFAAGRLEWLISVNVLTEGFNAKCVDCVAMLRPTQSKGLWVQAVGRGLRIHPSKEYCLILDYGDNIARHGPIDLPEDAEVKLATCGDCLNEFSRAVRKCPACGWEIPPAEQREFEEAEERKRTMHNPIAGDGLLVNEDKWISVDGCTLRLHRKAGKPDSVRIEWLCGLTTVKEWVCLDHEAYAGLKAKRWIADMDLKADSVAEFMATYTGRDLFNRVARIRVGYEGKHLKRNKNHKKIKDMKTIQLQSYGHAPAKPAAELKEGDVTIWNFGIKEKVTGIIRETEKTIIIGLRGENKPYPHARKFLKTRLVAVA